MAIEKRPRGRPRGSGKNDFPYLTLVADLIVRDPSLKPTTAMKRVMLGRKWTETDETLIRRWQVKWKADGVSLLAAARERVRPRSPAVPAHFMDTTWMLSITNMENSPINKWIRQMENSPINKWMKQMENSPINKWIKQVENSPIRQAIDNATAFQRQLAETAKQPGFQRMIENAAVLQRQFAETVKQLGFQRMIENVAALQRQVGQARLGPVNI